VGRRPPVLQISPSQSPGALARRKMPGLVRPRRGEQQTCGRVRHLPGGNSPWHRSLRSWGSCGMLPAPGAIGGTLSGAWNQPFGSCLPVRRCGCLRVPAPFRNIPCHGWEETWGVARPASASRHELSLKLTLERNPKKRTIQCRHERFRDLSGSLPKDRVLGIEAGNTRISIARKCTKDLFARSVTTIPTKKRRYKWSSR